MEVKIETRETFSIITPVVEVLSAILADNLRVRLGKEGQLGSQNLIIDLAEVGECDPEAVDKLVEWHEESYSNNNSLVFTQPAQSVLNTLHMEEKDLLLNLAPRMVEAIDIVSMEILERDLLGEE